MAQQKQIESQSQKINELEIKLKERHKVFSTTQLEHLTGKLTRKWSDDDIRNGIRYHYKGPHLYNVLRADGYPFPASSTLREWVRKVEVNLGLIDISLQWMRDSKLNFFEKVINFFIIAIFQGTLLYSLLHIQTLFFLRSVASLTTK